MNYWLVVPLVFCENRNINVMKEAMLRPLGYLTEREQYIDIQELIQAYQDGDATETFFSKNIFSNEKRKKNRLFENVDGIKFLQHEMGCGGTRGDSTVLCNLLAGYINHPNVAGATILSLGCQNAQIPDLKAALELQNPNFNKPLYIFEQQSSVSEPDFIATAVKQTFIGLTEANKIKRQTTPLSKLIIGLKCGGSDGFSGISANPTLGHVSDLTVRLGGSTILAEFPELNGVEQELVNRCEHKEDAEKFVHLMEAFRRRAEAVGSGFDANPSPGNIRDGLITDAMKSAGAAKKGGNANIVKVLDYAEQVYESGLHLLCTPGNDVEATTGLAGSGANIILFTTGLGTPTGNAIAPTIKISTNNALTKRMHDIIDFNTGDIIEGAKSIAECGEELLEYIIKVASGEATPAAVAMGQDDFIPWKREVSL